MEKKIPTRKCVGCGNMIPKKDLIRVVKNAEGEVFIDKKGKADGRGAYVCKNPECLDKADKRRAFERSLHVQLSQDVLEEIKKELI